MRLLSDKRVLSDWKVKVIKYFEKSSTKEASKNMGVRCVKKRIGKD